MKLDLDKIDSMPYTKLIKLAGILGNKIKDAQEKELRYLVKHIKKLAEDQGISTKILAWELHHHKMQPAKRPKIDTKKSERRGGKRHYKTYVNPNNPTEIWHNTTSPKKPQWFLELAKSGQLKEAELKDL